MRLLNDRKMLQAYLITVAVPLLVIIIYLMIFAKDRFVSESVIIIKQAGEVSVESSNGLGALLGVSNTSSEDAKILIQYIRSRDMVEKLDKQLNLKKAFENSEDIVFRLKRNSTIEEFVEYYNRRVTVVLDENSMMLNIVTEGFESAFALKLNEEILKNSEVFINDISRKIAQEQLKFSVNQLNDAKANLNFSRDQLLKFQNKNEMFDPQAQAQALAQIVASLESNLVQLKTEERMLMSYLNPEAAQVIAVRSQIEALQRQIRDEKNKLTSHQSSKLNKSVSDFAELKTEVEFQIDLYKLALASLEKARLEVSRKLKNLVIISSPQLSQEALHPKKLYICFTAFILLNVIFFIGALILSIIREHKES